MVERIGEVAILVLVKGMISTDYIPAEALWFIPCFCWLSAFSV